MFWNKCRITKKGYALIYTLLLCSICMIIVLFLFDLEMKETKNTVSYRNYCLKEKDYEDLKEILFTKLFKSVYANVSSLTINNVKSYLAVSNLYYKTEDNKGCIKYDGSINKIVYESLYEINYCRKDLYDYKIVENKLKLIYLRTLYIRGGIE